MANQDPAIEASAKDRVRDTVERNRKGVRRLVGVEVEFQADKRGGAQNTVEKFIQIRHHECDAAKHAFGDGDTIDKRTEPRMVAHLFDRDQGRRLQRDPTGPALAHCLEHRPGDGLLRRDGIEMRAKRRRSVRVGAAK
jgi:hypothetical protein